MSKDTTKTAATLVFSFFILSGCQYLTQAKKPIDDLTDIVTSRVQLEQQKRAETSLSKIKCQELCQSVFVSGDISFGLGKCLSEAIIPDWSCDLVHVPRQEEDDNPENQCAFFREGKTHHFIEVDGNCSIIRVY